MLNLPTERGKRVALLLLGAGYTLAGVNHFLNPSFYLEIMPPYLPAHLMFIYVSGFFEVLGGLGVLTSKYREPAGWGIVLLLFAVLPAHIHMAWHPEQFPSIPNVAIYGRLPLQLFLMFWARWATKPV